MKVVMPEAEFKMFAEKGMFVARRIYYFYGGNFKDQLIEQCLMSVGSGSYMQEPGGRNQPQSPVSANHCFHRQSPRNEGIPHLPKPATPDSISAWSAKKEQQEGYVHRPERICGGK